MIDGLGIRALGFSGQGWVVGPQGDVFSGSSSGSAVARVKGFFQGLGFGVGVSEVRGAKLFVDCTS